MSLNVIPFPGRIPQWTFAERARKVRRDLGLTQQQMADALEVGLKRYSAWESGKNTPDDITGIAVAFERVSGTPRTWFLGWSNEESPRPDGPGGGIEAGSKSPAGETSLYHLRPRRTSSAPNFERWAA